MPKLTPRSRSSSPRNCGVSATKGRWGRTTCLHAPPGEAESKSGAHPRRSRYSGGNTGHDHQTDRHHSGGMVSFVSHRLLIVCPIMAPRTLRVLSAGSFSLSAQITWLIPQQQWKIRLVHQSPYFPVPLPSVFAVPTVSPFRKTARPLDQSVKTLLLSPNPSGLICAQCVPSGERHASTPVVLLLSKT